MKNIANLLRHARATEAALRGPKKKGQVQAKIQSNDIINIFKDRPDPEPQDIRTYPLYVQQMAKGQLSIHELLYGTQLAIPALTPTRATYKSFLRGIKRQRFKALREFKQMDTKSIEDSEKFDIHHRTTVYDMMNKSKEELEEERKKQEAEMAEDDDDDF